ncbi:MAG: hypothetical protein ACR2JB_07530 [Bryobacteraceae bacterium]
MTSRASIFSSLDISMALRSDSLARTLNANNYVRMGLGFNQGVVFRMALGGKSVPRPAWIPGVVRGVLHLDLWWY